MFPANLVRKRRACCECYLKYVPLKMIQALERAVTEFLKLKAEAGSDELLIVAHTVHAS